MSPRKRYAKKQAKARQRRRLHAKERHEQQQRQAQRDKSSGLLQGRRDYKYLAAGLSGAQGEGASERTDWVPRSPASGRRGCRRPMCRA